MKIKELIQEKRPTINKISSFVSILAPLSFGVFNMFLGIMRFSYWNLSIGIYYCLLLIVRISLLYATKKITKENPSYLKLYIASSIFLLIMNVSLAVPISLLVLNMREVTSSMVIGIAIAAYTTYKVTASIINYKKTKGNNDLIEKEKRRINLYDSLVSILTLQNALICINNSSPDKDMRILVIMSSFIIYAYIVISSIVYFIKDIKFSNKKKEI